MVLSIGSEPGLSLEHAPGGKVVSIFLRAAIAALKSYSFKSRVSVGCPRCFGGALNGQPGTDGEYLAAISAAIERLSPERFRCFRPPGNNGLRKDEDSRRSFSCFLLDKLRRDEVLERLRDIAEVGVDRSPSGRRRNVSWTEEPAADCQCDVQADQEASDTPTAERWLSLRRENNPGHQRDRREAGPSGSRKEVTRRGQRRSRVR